MVLQWKFFARDIIGSLILCYSIHQQQWKAIQKEYFHSTCNAIELWRLVDCGCPSASITALVGTQRQVLVQ